MKLEAIVRFFRSALALGSERIEKDSSAVRIISKERFITSDWEVRRKTCLF